MSYSYIAESDFSLFIHSSLFFRVCAINLRFNEAFEHIVNVPACTEALRLPQLDNFRFCGRPAQSMNVDPCDAAE